MKSNSSIIKFIEKLSKQKKYVDIIEYILLFDEIIIRSKYDNSDFGVYQYITSYNHDTQVLTYFYSFDVINDISSINSRSLNMFEQSYTEYIEKELIINLNYYNISFKQSLKSKLYLL